MNSRQKNISLLVENFGLIKRKMMETHNCDIKGTHITPAQWHLLFIIKDREGISVKELAAILKITSSAATQLTDPLVENNFLVREYDQHDRRLLKISLSDESKKMVSQMKAKNIIKVAQIFEALDNDELDQFLKMSAKITANIINQQKLTNKIKTQE